MKSKLIAALFAALSVAACQTAQPPSTASGKPETTIRAPVSKIKALIISRAMNNGMSITKDTEYMLQFEKPTANLGAAVLLGSRYDSTPNERYVVTFAPLGDETRVVISSMFVTNPGSGFERITPINAGEGIERTQQTLREIQQQAEAAPSAQVASNKQKK
ncbi:hypothetical protein [Afipia carboxidovorans]|uniref:hypothetical protein n=1 Tax=Afipia carboxidovorans TaxID=40137 RepID=UPI00308F1917|nr:hypothetical protein CRBSH125_22040 [Afipia carboxidovorans]